MRKLASLGIAVLASFALAATASATLTVSVIGPNTPGTNTYSIVLTTDTADGIVGIGSSIFTTGLYTGIFTDGPVASFPTNLAGPLSPPVAAGTGYAGSWAMVAGSPQAGGSFTIGTVQITVSAGQIVRPDLTGVLDGFVTSGFSTVFPAPSNVSAAITIIPEPTTAALLGLGIVGLVVAGRRNRA